MKCHTNKTRGMTLDPPPVAIIGGRGGGAATTARLVGLGPATFANPTVATEAFIGAAGAAVLGAGRVAGRGPGGGGGLTFAAARKAAGLLEAGAMELRAHTRQLIAHQGMPEFQVKVETKP